MRKLSALAAARVAKRAAQSRSRRELKEYWRANGFEKMRAGGVTYEPSQISDMSPQSIQDVLEIFNDQRAGFNKKIRRNKPVSDIRGLVSDEVRLTYANVIFKNQPAIREMYEDKAKAVKNKSE